MLAGGGGLRAHGPLPGAGPAEASAHGAGPALAPAAGHAARGQPGSGADTLRLAARIETRVLRMRPVAQQGSEAFVLQAAAAAAEFVAIGDLLRFDRGGVRLHARVQETEAARCASRCRAGVRCGRGRGAQVLGLALRERRTRWAAHRPR